MLVEKINILQVYKLSDVIRGRVLVINISSFPSSEYTRRGSLADCNNLCKVFRELRFEIVNTPDTKGDWKVEVSILIDIITNLLLFQRLFKCRR